MILLDTHVLIWLRQGSDRLGRKTLRRVDGALRDGVLAMSAFSFWEIAMLVKASRLRLRATVEDFRAATLGAGVVELAVDGAIAALSTRLEGLHGDPADRILVATALSHAAALATADAALLRMKGGPVVIDASG